MVFYVWHLLGHHDWRRFIFWLFFLMFPLMLCPCSLEFASKSLHLIGELPFLIGLRIVVFLTGRSESIFLSLEAKFFFGFAEVF